MCTKNTVISNLNDLFRWLHAWNGCVFIYAYCFLICLWLIYDYPLLLSYSWSVAHILCLFVYFERLSELRAKHWYERIDSIPSNSKSIDSLRVKRRFFFTTLMCKIVLYDKYLIFLVAVHIAFWTILPQSDVITVWKIKIKSKISRSFQEY